MLSVMIASLEDVAVKRISYSLTSAARSEKSFTFAPQATARFSACSLVLFTICTSTPLEIRCFAVISDISPTPITKAFFPSRFLRISRSFATATLAIETGFEEIFVRFLISAAQRKA